MKNIILLLILLCSVQGISQDQQFGTEIFDVVEVAPEFKGGMDKLYEYLGANVKYPAKAMNENIQGKVYVQFVVTKKGKIVNVEIAKSAHKLLDNEALRVISKMPKWSPGEQKGKKVNVRYTIPINFTID